jgi:hypothetical protein
MASADFLMDMGANVFRPDSTNVWERFEEYSVAYIYENAALMVEAERLLAAESEAKLLGQMTDGQRHLYVLGTFDSQVNNGGVYQFFFNAGHLAHEVTRSLDELQCTNLRAIYAAVLAAQEHDVLLLTEAQKISGEEFAKTGPGTPTQRAHAAYEGGRLAIKEWADKLEDRYYPRWDEATNKFSFEAATLRLEMCGKVVEYVERHPGEFQVLRN